MGNPSQGSFDPPPLLELDEDDDGPPELVEVAPPVPAIVPPVPAIMPPEPWAKLPVEPLGAPPLPPEPLVDPVPPSIVSEFAHALVIESAINAVSIALRRAQNSPATFMQPPVVSAPTVHEVGRFCPRRLFLTFPMGQCIHSGVKLSNKGRYGVRALFDIAFYNDGRPTQIREIAERELIPARFLEQIFQDLKKAGLIASKRGPRGGYQLARPAAEISIGDIIRALEGPVAVLINEDEPKKGLPDPTAAIFRDLAVSVEKCFDAITIADVCERGAALGVRKKARERTSYVI